MQVSDTSGGGEGIPVVRSGFSTGVMSRRLGEGRACANGSRVILHNDVSWSRQQEDLVHMSQLLCPIQWQCTLGEIAVPPPPKKLR